MVKLVKLNPMMLQQTDYEEPKANILNQQFKVRTVKKWVNPIQVQGSKNDL